MSEDFTVRVIVSPSLRQLLRAATLGVEGSIGWTKHQLSSEWVPQDLAREELVLDVVKTTRLLSVVAMHVLTEIAIPVALDATCPRGPLGQVANVGQTISKCCY